MTNPIHDFYESRNEANKAIFMILRDMILAENENITEEWKFRLPFFCFKKKMMLYFWEDKKTGNPYIGFVDGNLIDHPLLEQGNRKRMKILNLDPEVDIPIKEIKIIVRHAINILNENTSNRLFKR